MIWICSWGAICAVTFALDACVSLQESNTWAEVNYFLTPRFWEEITNMNIVGCWFCTILAFIFNPIPMFMRFLYWLFHL